MTTHVRADWQTQLDEALRARHYAWLGEGLSSESPAEASIALLCDLMHLAEQEDLDFQRLLAQARVQFEQETIEHRFNAI